MAKMNWLRDETLPAGHAHKIGEPGWEHYVVTGSDGREHWLTLNMDGLCSAINGFIARCLDVAATARGETAFGGEAAYGGWWESFTKGAESIAKLAMENRGKLAALLPEGQEAATRLIAKYRGGDKVAAGQILQIANEAKKGNRDSAAMLDALRAEEMVQDTAGLPVILQQRAGKGNLVESVVSGRRCWMSNAEFGASAATLKAKAAAKAKAKAAAKRKQGQLSSKPGANSPLRTMPSTARAAMQRPGVTARRPTPGMPTLAQRPPMAQVHPLSPGVRPLIQNYAQTPLGYPTQPAYYPTQPMYYPTSGPGQMMLPGGYDDDEEGDVTAEDMEQVWGPQTNDTLPEDMDDEAADETDEEAYPADYDRLGAELDVDRGESDHGLKPDADLSVNAAGNYDLMQEAVENVGSPDVAGEPTADPFDNVAEAADDPMNVVFDNRGDPEMGGAYKATLDEAKVVAKLSAGDRAQLKALKKPDEIKAFLTQKAAEQQARGAQREQANLDRRRAAEVKKAQDAALAKVKADIARTQQQARRQMQQVQAQSVRGVEQRSAAERRLNVRRAEQDQYQQQINDLEDQMQARDISEAQRAALEAQADAYEQQIAQMQAQEPALARPAARDDSAE